MSVELSTQTSISIDELADAITFEDSAVLFSKLAEQAPSSALFRQDVIKIFAGALSDEGAEFLSDVLAAR